MIVAARGWGAAGVVLCTLAVGCGDDQTVPPDAASDATDPAACDDHNACTIDHVAGGACAHDSVANCCGNRVVEAGEACDDGNQADYDGCSSTCVFERALMVETVAMAPPNEGCDLTGDGMIDNVGSNALNDQGRLYLGDLLTRTSFQGNPVVALMTFVGTDEQMLNGSWTLFFLGGADMDGDVTDNISGNEPFLVVADTLDVSGRPMWAVTGRASMGNWVTDLGTIVIPLPRRDQLERQEFAHATLSGTLMSDPRGPTRVAFRLCGAQTAASFYRIPDDTGVGGAGATVLDALALGQVFFGVRINATQPDFDVDGDGIESLRDTDGDHLIDLCIDGNGTQIQARDCALDPRIADGYSIAWDLTAVRAILAGRKP